MLQNSFLRQQTHGHRWNKTTTNNQKCDVYHRSIDFVFIQNIQLIIIQTGVLDKYQEWFYPTD